MMQSTRLSAHLRIVFGVAATLIIFYVFYHRNTAAVPSPQLVDANRGYGDQAANATLGFEKILVLSQRPSWRTRGIQAAAKLSGIDLTIPPQPRNPSEIIDAFKAIGSEAVPHPGIGSATAWLAHLDLIKFVIASGFETAIIVEDDVDWDITVKDQMKLMSHALRKFTNVPDGDPHPYGLDWDILWFGHCGGDYENNTDTPRAVYRDPSVRDTWLYNGWMKNYVTTMPEKTRYIQRGAGLVCTFAYAINSGRAQNLLTWGSKGQDTAFDLRIRTGCMMKTINCITVFPEIMHHYEPMANYRSEVRAGDGNGEPLPDGFEQKMGETANIPNSARCKALFDKPCPAPPSEEDDYGSEEDDFG